MSRTVLLVRHPPVEERYRAVCYGVTDAPLAPHGREMIPELARLLTREPISMLVHSGLSRTWEIAFAISTLTLMKATVDHLLRERNFGEWEGRMWDDIHAETGDDMMRMVSEPEVWCPPGGETTFQVRDRMLDWYRNLPREGRIVAITHAGPIAALRGVITGAPVTDWPNLIPPPGSLVRIE